MEKHKQQERKRHSGPVPHEGRGGVRTDPLEKTMKCFLIKGSRTALGVCRQRFIGGETSGKEKTMKNVKRMMAFVVAMIMVAAMGATAFAGTISVTNVLEGETYTAYKILNYKDDGDQGNERAVSYYLTAAEYSSIGSVLEAAGFAFTGSSDGTQYSVTNAADIDVAAAAAYLGSHTADLGNALGKFTATGQSGEATFTDLPTGYYFVTSSAGTLCALHEDDDIETAVEKNTVPTVNKKEKTSGVDYVDGPVDANIGDTVHYEIVVTDGTGTNAAITLTDTMTAGLDYTAGSLKINGTAVVDDADTDNWKVTVSGRVITIVFKAAYVASVGSGESITVTYDATINANAVVDSATGNENKAELDYSQQHSEDKVYVETYDFQLKKTDGTKFLNGAGFKLYDASTGGNQIKLGKDNTGYYVDASADEEIIVDSQNGVNVRGLAPGTYYLEETTVPDGYNILAGREEVTITTGATAAVEVTVVNHAGTELPSTGGIGTTIFYIVGAILVVIAGVLLVTRRRMRDE